MVGFSILNQIGIIQKIMHQILVKISSILCYLFGVNVGVTIFLFITGFISVLSICFYCLILFLDSTYKPNIPYNIIADSILRWLFMISPIIVTLYINPHNTIWVQEFSYILGIHCFFIMPIIYKGLTIAPVYAAFFGVYFFINCYDKLRQEIFIMNLFYNINIYYIIVSCFRINLLFVRIMLFLKEIILYKCLFNYVSIIRLVYFYLLKYNISYHRKVA